MAKTKGRRAKWSPSELIRLWEGLQSNKDNPEGMKILGWYMDAVIAKQEGRLTPERVAHLERFTELIHCTHQLYCGTPKPTPEQALILETRIKELTQIEQPQAEAQGGEA